MARFTIQDIQNYLSNHWYDSESWSDINMAIDSGHTLLAAQMLKEAGAIDSRHCYDEAKPIERAIEARLKKYTTKEFDLEFKDVFDSAEIWIHDANIEYAFVKNKYTDYLTDPTDMKDWGWRPEQSPEVTFYKDLAKLK